MWRAETTVCSTGVCPQGNQALYCFFLVLPETLFMTQIRLCQGEVLGLQIIHGYYLIFK